MAIDRKSIRIQIGDILDRQCTGCEIKTEYYRANPNKGNVPYCTQGCATGKKLLQLGGMINAPKAKEEKRMDVAVDEVPNKAPKRFNVTKEFIEAEFAKGKTASQIEKELGMSENYLYSFMKKWGLKSPRKGDVVPNDSLQQKELENADLRREVERLRGDIMETESRLGKVIRGLEADIERLTSEREPVSTEPSQDSVAFDPVHHPAHYSAGKVECIIAIEVATQGLSGIEAVCTGNAIKYLWRWKRKNGVQDLEKARWYLDRLIGNSQNAEGGKNDES